MFRIILAGLIGAALMYVFDPKQGKDRREALSSRMHDFRHRAEDATAKGKDAMHQVKDTAEEARHRARRTVSHAEERFEPVVQDASEKARETAHEAKSEAEKMASSTQSRARSTMGHDGEDTPAAP